MSEGRALSLTREQIIGLLAELGQDLDASGVKAQLFVVGGAAMALADNMRRTTADVDGVFEPEAVIYEAARRVADRHEKLPADWLNDGVKGLLPRGADRHARVILDLPGADDVLRIAEQVIGSNRLLPKAQFIVQEMFPGDAAEPSPP